MSHQVKRALWFVVAALTAVPLVANASDPLVVKTDKGDVRGTLTPDGKVRAFKAIPFAAPPVGDLRWQPPQPAANWKGVRDATRFGPHCMQAPGGEFHTFRDPGPSEDCLTLDVWAPADAKNRKLPVLVYIYGGGFRTGGTSEPRQDGEGLAHHDVVFVALNYRLGIFGFFVHPELIAESPHHAAGNYGLLDQDAALGWVQANIASFGGDPRNVTIMGQSAGSISVSLLMASPLSRGKFAKAIGQSGGEFGTFVARSSDVLAPLDAKFAQTAFGTSRLAALRALPADELLKQTQAHAADSPFPNAFWPDIDGWFLPETVEQTFAEGKQAHVPLLAGWTADEQRSSVTLAKTQPTAETFRQTAEAEFGGRAPEFLKLYPAATDAEAVRSAGDLADDRFISYSTWRWLDLQAQTGGAPVYRYRFDLASPGDARHPRSIGAFHSDDIDYGFGELDSREGVTWRPEDYKLSAEMVQYFTDFMRTGNPNGAGLPAWPAYNAADGWPVMHLDAPLHVEADGQRARYKFLESEWDRAATQAPAN